MPLSELQQPLKSDFYAKVRNKATTYHNTIRSLVSDKEFLALMDQNTITNMGIPDDVRDDLIGFRTAINESTDFYEGTSTTQTVVPKDIINRLRNL